MLKDVECPMEDTFHTFFATVYSLTGVPVENM